MVGYLVVSELAYPRVSKWETYQGQKPGNARYQGGNGTGTEQGLGTSTEAEAGTKERKENQDEAAVGTGAGREGL